MKKPVEPILVAHLFPEMRTELLRVLHSLTDEQWQAPTACAGWSVKDVALHIFSDEVGYLSRYRDNDGITFVVDSWAELVEKINHQNETWVQATRRMSRNLLLSLLEFTGEQLAEFLATIDVHQSTSPVSWAGNQNAPMWLQLAREFTEFWMHHQHICEAAHITSLKSRRYFHPVLSAFVFALPHTLRDTDASVDTTVKFMVTGEAADSWYVIRDGDGWHLYANTDIEPITTVTMPEDTAWRLFTKGIDSTIAAKQTTITGNQNLGEILLNTIAIIA
jgi:uncharacterized protein (TIGR03083 family)